jgi:hypothetical protein
MEEISKAPMDEARDTIVVVEPEAIDQGNSLEPESERETDENSSDITAMPAPKKLQGTEISAPRKRWLCCTWFLTWYFTLHFCIANCDLTCTKGGFLHAA